MRDRQAQFTPLQQQSFENAGLMQTAPQLGDATAMAGMAGLGALNTQYTFNPYQTQQFTGTNTLPGYDAAGKFQPGTGAVGQYMSPYIQNVLDNQIAASNRGYDISGMQENARATQANAFGGGRQAIMQAENERARNSANQAITAKGLQDAFSGATQQYNTGLGQMQTLGGQQQAQYQKQLDAQYQEFLNQQNQPYKQLSYMSDLIRGQPLGQQSSNQVYQAPPSTVSQLAGLGTAGIAGLGLYNAMGGSGTAKS
jgi:hypothetical protein